MFDINQGERKMSTGTMKLNNSTEVIPIQGSSDKRVDPHKARSRPGPAVSKSRHDRKRTPYFSDPMIVPRVKQYLEEHSHDVRIDFEDMVDSLQMNFKDYAKRKRSAFKGLVDKAYYVVLQECKANRDKVVDGNVTSESSGEEDFDSDEMLDEDSYIENGNKTNLQLMSMYANAQTRKIAQPADLSQELINISSSEDEGDGAKKEKLVEPVTSTPKATAVTSVPPPPATVITQQSNFAVANGRKHIPPLLATPNYSARSPTVYPTTERVRKRKFVETTLGSKTPIIQKKKREVTSQSSRISFKDFGGNRKVLEEVCKLLVHIRHPEVYHQVGVSPPRGFLLHGPPGCGKTLLAQAIAGELEIPLIKVAATELVAGVSGQSEERIRDLFEQAVAASPCVLFLDEVDAITPNRQMAQREMERRIVAQLLTCLDDLGQKENGDRVLVIGATNRPDSLDPALRRAGRFDREICLGIPNLDARIQILKVVGGRLRLAPGFSFNTIARNCPGFVGADLMALTREAAMAAVNRVFGDLKEKVDKKKKESEKMECDNAEGANEKLTHTEGKIKGLIEKPMEVTETSEHSKCKEKNSDDPSRNDKPTDDKLNDDKLNDDKPNDDKSEVGKPEDEPPTDGDAKDIEPNSDIHKDDPPKEKVAVTEKCPLRTDKVIIEEKMDVSEDPPPVPDTETSGVVEIPSQICATRTNHGPVLEELISWLHDQVPLSLNQLEALFVEEGDFEQALKCVQPSSKREGFATVPDVTWDDIGSLQDIREELKMAILTPVRHPALCVSLGLSSPTGVLLCGPPGCGKTLLAKAVANEAGINFISVKGPELLNMYLGESERAVRQCFQRARNSAPCVIFFDELDSLCPKRSESGEGASMRVVNQMLTEMDGMEDRKDVYLMAATNRPDMIDSAVLRPGRLDKILYVGLPSAKDRVEILNALTKNGTKPALADDVSLEALGECSQCEGYTGADLSALVREASMETLKEAMLTDNTSTHLVVTNKHFNRALEKIRPSVSEKEKKYYEKLREIYTAVPQHQVSTEGNK